MTTEEYNFWNLIFSGFTAFGTVGATFFAVWQVFKKNRPNLNIFFDGGYKGKEQIYTERIFVSNTGGFYERIISFGIETGIGPLSLRSPLNYATTEREPTFPINLAPGTFDGYELTPDNLSRLLYMVITNGLVLTPIRIRRIISDKLFFLFLLNNTKICVYSDRGGVIKKRLDSNIKSLIKAYHQKTKSSYKN
ncbi:hypothetical protein [Maridesulfovibrio salexigens]|uniref:Uncharacterized protein n=1 Tax=Maridesulfovibrio salexigens (strain ATCC 14822 / DSM 2638 / NCIMB 8403 / VKM B-1763) TaxID=526222 RepID=C6BWP5_MARSD|nr:hypothetical protein [Maridesulfovibrio salexigens]ACS80325.1 hypothetical protein Desal_2269 [Maridesulfovibrio salexigens DSM 2638]